MKITENGTFEQRLRKSEKEDHVNKETGYKITNTKFLQYSSKSKETFMVRADLVMTR